MKNNPFPDRLSISAKGLWEAMRIGQKIRLIDLRTPADFEKWHIPGAECPDINEELKAGEFEVLETLDLHPDTPVVFICQEGILGKMAARTMSDLGYNAFALENGMLGWSALWDTMVLEIDSSNRIIQFRRLGKGCLSYMLISRNEALVIDPSLPPEVYQQVARQHRAFIKYVMETHLHADHLMRGLRLAQLCRARYLLPHKSPVDFRAEFYDEHFSLTSGNGELKALAMPGHTPESHTLVWNNQWIFTGDLIFHDAIGRPDLRVKNSGDLTTNARQLLTSMHKLISLFPDAFFFGGHFKDLSGLPDHILRFNRQDILRRYPNPDLWDKNLFPMIINDLPEPPPHFEEIIAYNRQGNFPAPPDDFRLEAGNNHCSTS